MPHDEAALPKWGRALLEQLRHKLDILMSEYGRLEKVHHILSGHEWFTLDTGPTTQEVAANPSASRTLFYLSSEGAHPACTTYSGDILIVGRAEERSPRLSRHTAPAHAYRPMPPSEITDERLAVLVDPDRAAGNPEIRTLATELIAARRLATSLCDRSMATYHGRRGLVSLVATLGVALRAAEQREKDPMYAGPARPDQEIRAAARSVLDWLHNHPMEY